MKTTHKTDVAGECFITHDNFHDHEFVEFGKLSANGQTVYVKRVFKNGQCLSRNMTTTILEGMRIQQRVVHTTRPKDSR